MGTIVRRNERSWAIVIISEIRVMLDSLNLKIKSAGGESTLSVNKQSMFPDVLLYEDEAQTKILQGWELKMPDVLITDEALIADATRKAKALGLNSFIIWNFTYGKLYVETEGGVFEEAKAWTGTSHIKSREDVMTYKSAWLPVVKEIVLTVNEYLVNGVISAAPIFTTISDGLITEVIQRNKELVAENICIEAQRSMPMESRIKVWWNAFREEYDKDESNMYVAYAKSILLNWTNRITFANAIKKYHNCAYAIKNIDSTTSPEDGNIIIEKIIEQGDFYNVFKKIEYNEVIPEDTWIDIVDYNQFLVENNIEQIDQAVLQDVLEKTVNTTKREIRGQFATPYPLADLLCQMTINDWTKACADLCAGTGTIAKAIIDNKVKRTNDPVEALNTTWISDKYAYPLQIANISVTNIHAFNVPINMFQSDVFNVDTRMLVNIKSPVDGSNIEKEIPQFGAIVSNLPFVEYNKIAADEKGFIEEYNEKIKATTGIEFMLGKADLYNYLPFKLHELLADGGNLGIILSNSWLGTDIGRKFYTAIQYYYHIKSVVMSNCNRWFKNADVVGTLLILEKKQVSEPNLKEEVCFWLLNKDIRILDIYEKETVVNGVVLSEEIDSNIATMKKYTLENIEQISSLGTTLNSLFHDVEWIDKIKDKLIPIENLLTVKRGERRGWNELFYPSEKNEIEDEYIKPVLKNPALLKSYTAETDIQAFCCHRSKEQLLSLGHIGAIKWIEKFENIKNGTGKLLSVALKRSGSYWYEMDDTTKADYVTALNPDKRLFFAKFDEPTFVDQRFTRLLLKNKDVSSDLIHALLNSIYGLFAIEAIGFGRGLGVLDASSSKLKNMYMINPEKISASDKKEIIDLFAKIKSRDVMDIEDELSDPMREKFDHKVLAAIGQEDLYEAIKKSLLSMQHTRHCVK
jgi:hypothetical protein